jgi:two-component system response regulator HydG
MAKILVVDDQRNMRSTLSLMLRGAGHDVTEAVDGEQACAFVDGDAFDLVLTDLRMAGKDGLDVLRHVKDVAPMTEVLVMTAYGTIETAVEAMRAGAYDYIQKPFAEEELLVKIERAIEKRKLAGAMNAMTASFREQYGFANIIGRSASIRDLLARIIRIAPTDTTVLVTGESGTGKELVARAIHANSTRSDRPFVTINCAAVSETLLESELFGHVRGAYTGAVTSRRGLFEEANGGTFFFDEIAETQPAFQAKLLRAIQEGEIRRLGDNKPTKVDVRIIAATNQDLQEAISDKRFRLDLYYRLNVARFVLPPLRDRREDIPLLVEHFMAKYARKMRRQVELGDGVVDYLQRYEFPGNIRELENMIEQGVALAVGGRVRLDDIVPPEIQQRVAPLTLAPTKSLHDAVDRAERETITAVLREVDGNRERAAEMLGLSGTTLWRKMRRLNVQG